mgnify:CR=1 FL=1
MSSLRVDVPPATRQTIILLGKSAAASYIRDARLGQTIDDTLAEVGVPGTLGQTIENVVVAMLAHAAEAGIRAAIEALEPDRIVLRVAQGVEVEGELKV